MTKTKNNVLKLLPMMFAFFAMGFVDMVGIATNYVKEDFALSDTVANFLPSMVFFWFLILSVPASLMMNRIGRRKTVLVSLVVTSLALFVPDAGKFRTPWHRKRHYAGFSQSFGVLCGER